MKSRTWLCSITVLLLLHAPVFNVHVSAQDLEGHWMICNVKVVFPDDTDTTLLVENEAYVNMSATVFNFFWEGWTDVYDEDSISTGIYSRIADTLIITWDSEDDFEAANDFFGWYQEIDLRSRTIFKFTNDTLLLRVLGEDAEPEEVKEITFSLIQAQSSIPADGLVAYYPFNGNANDESGNGNDGTVNGAALSADRFGNASSAYSFDGVDDLITGSLSVSARFDTAITTIAWFYQLAIPNYPGEGIVGVGPYGIGNQFFQRLGPGSSNSTWDGYDGQNRLWLGADDGQTDKWWASNAVIAIQQWHLATTTYSSDSREVKIFVDGVLDRVVTLSAALSIEDNFSIGCDAHNDNHFEGYIDDVRIYDRALSATEIDSLYHEGGWDPGLVAYYPFSGNAADESGNGHDGTVNGATLTTDRFGNALSAYSYDGTGQYIQLTGITVLPEYSISLWYVSYGMGNHDGMQILTDRSECYGAYNTHCKVWMRASYADSLSEVAVGTRYNGSFYPMVESFGAIKSDWNHIVGIWEGLKDSVSLYLNGVFVGSVGNADVRDLDLATSTIGVAFRPDYGMYFHGIIDDIRIYDRALSEAEIQALYHEGGWDPGLVAHYPFNGNANDESGNGNHGTVNGAALAADRFGNANSAYSFDGVDDWIDIPDWNWETNIDYTIVAWIKSTDSDDAGSDWRVGAPIVGDEYATTHGEVGLDNGRIAYNYFGEPSGIEVQGATNVADDNWHILSWVNHSNNTIDLYVDGSVELQGVASGPVADPTKFIASTLGKGALDWFDGTMDDVRIYNRALSGAEIDSLYHEGGGDTGNTISHWTFDEMAGDTLYDVSGNGHHGVITKASWGEGYSGGALQFGDSAYVTVPYAVATRPVEAITLEAIVLFETLDLMQAIVSTDENGGYGLWIYNSKPDIYIQIDSVYYNAAYSGGLVTDRWYHIAGVFDGAAVKYYVNRALKDSIPAPGVITYRYENALQIGADAGREDFPELITSFHGRIDAIRISGRALSPGEFLAFDATPVAVSPVRSGVPEGYYLCSAYPNPFNPNTTLRFDLPEAVDLTLLVYDLLGREVVRLVDGRREAGYHQLVWNGRDERGRQAPTGLYIVRMVTPAYTKSIKMVLLK